MRRLLLTIAIALAVPAAARAQDATVDPGMSRDEVVARLGRPLSERTAGAFVYLFYANGCERKCGFNDVVILENGAVIDAVFRGGRRTFSGESSSPAGTAPARTVGEGGGAEEGASPRSIRRSRSDKRVPVRSIRVAEPGATGDEVRLPPGTPRGGIVVGNPTNTTSQPPVVTGAAGAPAATPATGTANQGGPGTNAVPLATPPTVTKPTVTPPSGAVPAQGAAPAPTNAPASTAGPAAPNPRAPTRTPPAPSPTRPDSGTNPTPPAGTVPPARDTTKPPVGTLESNLERPAARAARDAR